MVSSSISRRGFLESLVATFGRSSSAAPFRASQDCVAALRNGCIVSRSDKATRSVYAPNDYRTHEAAIQRGIDYAANRGGGHVVLSADVLPYRAQQVKFDESVRMVREGNLSDVHDIKAYGASDRLRDNGPAIQAALSGANGGIVFVPPSGDAYVVRRSLSVPTGTVLEGVGKKGLDNFRSVFYNAARDGAPLLKIPNGGRDITIRDITLSGQGKGGSAIKVEEGPENFVGLRFSCVTVGSVGGHGIEVYNTPGVTLTIEDLHIRGEVAGHGLLVDGGQNGFIGMATARSVFVNGAFRNGFQLGQCRFTGQNCAAGNCGENGWVYGGSRHVLINCSAESNAKRGFWQRQSGGRVTLVCPFSIHQDRPFVIDSASSSILEHPVARKSDGEFDIEYTDRATGRNEIYGDPELENSIGGERADSVRKSTEIQDQIEKNQARIRDLESRLSNGDRP